MLETKCENSCQVQCSRAKPYCCWKQVEINCIASGFGHLGPASRVVQRFLALWRFIIVLYFLFHYCYIYFYRPWCLPFLITLTWKKFATFKFFSLKKKHLR
uniref:(northern house mosquito) hypothetical protein n=1 Tax=Culex pipiens TaxID=7175 RepID=A0A8D8FNH9_CULPI